jgi:hypothetical protein
VSSLGANRAAGYSSLPPSLAPRSPSALAFL